MRCLIRLVHDGVVAAVFTQGPGVVGVFAVVFGEDGVLVKEQVVAEGGDLAVQLELESTVVVLGCQQSSENVVF